MMYGNWMEKTTVYLDVSLAQNLRRTAKKTGLSQATIVRKALEDYFAQHSGHGLDGFIGCVRSGDPDLAAKSAEPTWR